MRQLATAGLLGFLAACSAPSNEVVGFADLERQIEGKRVGYSQDHWIEMRNGIGEWERTGLVFGYSDDYGECIKAIEGLQRVNTDREYRCVPAN